MAKPIVIGNKYFKTKTAATHEIRGRINNYDFGDTLSEEDTIFFSQLFKHHSEYPEKLGPGIDHITVERDYANHRSLYIHHTGGGRVDISWVHCLTPTSNKTIIQQAFRRSVVPRVVAFRNESLDAGSVCPVQNIELNIDNCHVAYPDVSFNELIDGFLSETNYELEDVQLINPPPADTDQRGQIKDNELRKEWQTYHGSNATMKLYSKRGNLMRKANKSGADRQFTS